MRFVALIAGCLLGASIANAGISIQASLDSSNVWDTANRTGAPSGPTDPSGYTCTTDGDASGSIDEAVDAETGWDYSVAGSSGAGNIYYCYKDGGGGDVQVAGEIQSGYSGTLQNSSLIEIGIKESTDDDSWYFACYSPYNTGRAVNCAYGTPPSSFTVVQGPTGLSRPIYAAVTYDVSSGTLKGWYCPAGADPASCVEIAETTRTLSDDLGYFGGKSGDPLSPMAATSTDNELVSTIDIYTPSDPGGSDPVWDTQIANQSWEVDVAITSIDVSSYCSITQGSGPTYTGSGLPTGISISSGGVISGTPTSVSSGNATITCSDTIATTDELFSWQVTDSVPSGCTGTTYQYTSATSIATINAASHVAGDCVDLNKGDTFTIASAAQRFNLKSGVTYRAYGTGNNPVIDCSGISLAFQGCIEASGDSNVQVQDWRVTDLDGPNGFLVRISGSSNITLQDSLFDTSVQGGVAILSSSGVTLDNLEIHTVTGNPHESLTINGSDDVTGFDLYVHDNGHAAINIKGASTNVEIYDSTFESTSSDATCYIERASGVSFHDNICRDSLTTLGRAIFGIAIEPFDTCSERYNRDIDVYNNVFYDFGGNNDNYGNMFRLWIKLNADACTPNPPTTQLMHDINIHHNTLVVGNTNPPSWHAAVFVGDSRASPDASDWSSLVFECNIIWDTDGGRAMLLQNGITWDTNRYNLSESGDVFTPSSALGDNAIRTATSPFTDEGSDDFTIPVSSAAYQACYDGSNVGAL